jgi:hypothetical protein
MRSGLLAQFHRLEHLHLRGDAALDWQALHARRAKEPGFLTRQEMIKSIYIIIPPLV